MTIPETVSPLLLRLSGAQRWPTGPQTLGWTGTSTLRKNVETGTKNGNGTPRMGLEHQEWEWDTKNGNGTPRMGMEHQEWEWDTKNGNGTPRMGMEHQEWEWDTKNGNGTPRMGIGS